MSKYQKLFLIVIALAITAAIVAWKIPLSKGLDIAGGIRVVLQVNPKNESDWPKDIADRRQKMLAIQDIISKRVMGLAGVAEPVVVVQNQTSNRPRVVVELPGIKDPDRALDLIRSTASLDFYYLKDVESRKNPLAPWKMSGDSTDSAGYVFTNPHGETISSKNQPKELLKKVVGAPEVKPVLTGEDLLATARTNMGQNNEIVIEIAFNPKGSQKFAKFTSDHVHEKLAIFFDGKLLTAPEIREKILSGKAEVSGFQSLEEARLTASTLNAGALPVPLKVIAKDTVEPTLGLETVNKVILAGIVGLALVVFFMLFNYRLPGAIASLALCLYALFTLSVFKAIHASMSLAGLAALIISIGMAVDANILIFERLKEELRSGKTLRAAIDAGFGRAFTAIFDSNMCTAITCAILMWYGTPSVKSFALTLLVGVLISMFTAITVTRTVLHLLVTWPWAQKPALYGLNESWFTKPEHHLNIVGKRAWYFAFSAILIIPGLYFLATSGLKPGIEFKSGTSIQATFEKPVELADVRNVVAEYTKESYEVQLAKKDGQNKMAFIKTEPLSEQKEADIKEALDSEFGLATLTKTGKPTFDSINSVGPTISKELTKNAVVSVIIASIAIVLYLTGRFAIGGLGVGLKFGVCAVIALVHDAAFILGLFAILGKYAGWEVDSLFVTAILTIIGFSVHDTIVVFDRIRENLRHRLRGESFEELANRSILQTFSRSINTSFTVVLTLGALIALGGPLLRHFYIALLAGIIIGTYSSIFNATPLIVVWEKIFAGGGAPKKKTFEEKAMVTPGNGKTEQPITTKEVAEVVGDDESDADKAASKTARIKRKKKRF